MIVISNRPKLFVGAGLPWGFGRSCRVSVQHSVIVCNPFCAMEVAQILCNSGHRPGEAGRIRVSDMAKTLAVRADDTLANVIRRRLGDRIMDGSISPGARLDEKSLAEEFGVSRTPIREALQQLALIGLVSSRPHSGTTVQPIDRQRVASICDAVTALEQLCARMSAARMTKRDLLRLDRAAAGYRAHLDDVEALAADSRAFHSILIAGTQNPHLIDAVEGARLKLAPFQKVQFQDSRRRRLVAEEFERIAAALRAGDAEGAAAAVIAHLTASALSIDTALAAMEAPA